MTAYQDLFSWRYPVTDQVVGHHDGVISVAVLYDGFHLEVKTLSSGEPYSQRHITLWVTCPMTLFMSVICGDNRSLCPLRLIMNVIKALCVARRLLNVSDGTWQTTMLHWA